MSQSVPTLPAVVAMERINNQTQHYFPLTGLLIYRRRRSVDVGLLSFKPIGKRICRARRQPMSLGRRARVAARLCGLLTGLQSLMMDEHCPLASLTSDRRQTPADACFVLL